MQREKKKTSGRHPFDDFCDELRLLAKASQNFLLKREPLNEAIKEFAKQAAHTVDGLVNEIDRVQKQAHQEKETLEIAAQVLVDTQASSILAQHRFVAAQAKTEASSGISLGTGLLVGKDVIDKIAEYMPTGPWKGVVKDVGYILGITAKLISTTGDEIARIELKVASLQESINGKPFPSGQIRGPVAGGKPPLRREIEELEEKIERFYEIVGGNPVPRDDSGAILPTPTDQVEYPELRGSLLWMSWQLEHKLDHVFSRLVGKKYPKTIDGAIQAPGEPRTENSINGGIDELRTKIDTLAKLLGKTLYDAEWNVEPAPAGGMRTVPRGERTENDTPPRSIKDELHDLENMLNTILHLLRIIIRLLRRRPPFEPPSTPPQPIPNPGDEIDLVVFPEDVKRIFVYDEGVFEATSSADKREIQIRTGAFDVAGWVDLSELEDGDRVEIAIHVRLPGGVRRLYRKSEFSGVAEARLIAIQDVAGSVTIVGNAVDITIRQVDSNHGFSPPMRITFQFVVESQ